MYIKMSETFIKIDSLQNLSYEPVKSLRYNIHCFDVMLILRTKVHKNFLASKYDIKHLIHSYAT